MTALATSATADNFVFIFPFPVADPFACTIYRRSPEMRSISAVRIGTKRVVFSNEFTINGDEVFCREGYVNAEALLAHLENVGAMLAQALTMADLIRIEVHGPAAELAKLKEPLAHLKPAWFELHS